MKNKENKIEDVYPLSIRINEEDRTILEKLRKEHAINVNQLFKNFIRNHYEKLNKLNVANE